jgi:hypothetical protein
MLPAGTEHDWREAGDAWRVRDRNPESDLRLGSIKQAVLEALETWRDVRGTYRFCNDHNFVIARRGMS